MSNYNIVSFLPPSRKYFQFSLDQDRQAKFEIEQNEFWKYKEMHMVDIIRSSGFVHHPARETNAIVEGEMLKNDQDRIVESMRIMMGEHCVKIGIWKDLKEAFSKSDMIREKRFRQMLRT